MIDLIVHMIKLYIIGIYTDWYWLWIQHQVYEQSLKFIITWIEKRQ